MDATATRHASESRRDPYRRRASSGRPGAAVANPKNLRVGSVPPCLPVSRVFALCLLSAVGLASCADCNKGSGGGGEALDAAAPVEAAAPAVPDGGALNVTPLPTASIAAAVNPDKLPAYGGPTGSIEGTITVTGDRARETPADFSRCPEAASTWGHAFREFEGGKGGARLLADAIVVVTGYKGFYIPEKEEAKEIRIENCAYTTRTATLTFGQRLEVKNLSHDFWTPQLEPQGTVVLTMVMPQGDPAKIYPKKPGHYLLIDRDRRFAVVDVYAFLHPLHASTDVAGHYRIDGLPVGKLKVGTTHPQIEASAEAEVTISAGVVHTLDLSLKNVNRDAGPRVVDDAGPPQSPLR